MVARTPSRSKKMADPLNPVLLRETVKKVDRCLARLQELQFTIEGGTKVISGVSLSPRSTRGYLRTSLRCKQESVRIKNESSKKSPAGKFQGNTGGEWQRMSLPAMLVNETVSEILHATQFAREIVSTITQINDPKTPLSHRRKQRPTSPNTSELGFRRNREKLIKRLSIRSEFNTPSLQRAKSRINFKISPTKKTEIPKENDFNRYIANRVSSKNKPWAKKAVLFPNPLFIAGSDSSQKQRFCRTGSPVIEKSKKVQTPHKFKILSPNPGSKFQSRIKSPQISISPARVVVTLKKSPKLSAASKFRRSFSPSRLANRLASSPMKPRKVVQNSESPKISTASKFRRSFSPSRLANRLASPLKSRKVVQKSDGLMMTMSGLKQRPSYTATPLQFSARRF